jgi:hypothetical protein
MSLRHLVVVAAVALTSCASYAPRVAVVRPGRLPGPRIVAFLDSGNEQFAKKLGGVHGALGLQLEAAGLEVKRFVRDGVPYGLEARGAPVLCAGGGIRFDWIEVDVVDLSANRVVHQVAGAGATEDCIVGHEGGPPAPGQQPRTTKVIRGTLYADLAKAIAGAWAATAPSSVPSAPPPTRGVSL